MSTLLCPYLDHPKAARWWYTPSTYTSWMIPRKGMGYSKLPFEEVIVYQSYVQGLLHYKINVLWDKNMQIQSTLNKLAQSFHVHLHQKADENLEKWCHPLWQNRPGVQAEPVASYSSCCQCKNHGTSMVLEFYGSFHRTCIIFRRVNLASERFISN